MGLRLWCVASREVQVLKSSCAFQEKRQVSGRIFGRGWLVGLGRSFGLDEEEDEQGDDEKEEEEEDLSLQGLPLITCGLGGGKRG
jgi:hypothetical protein